MRAAKSLLGRSKFSESTKKKILTCINKKAKALKCFKKDKEKASEKIDFPKFIELSYEEKKVYSSDIFEETKSIVEISIKYPDKDIEECYGIYFKESK